MANVPCEEDGRRTHFPRSFSCDTRSNGRSFGNVIRPTSPVFLFFLYIKKYATWRRLSQQTIMPTLTVGLTFNICRVSSVSSSSSRQSQTSTAGIACSPPTAGCAAAHASWPHRTLKLCASSPVPVHSCPRPHHRAPPWFARCGAALRCCQHGQQPRGIRR